MAKPNDTEYALRRKNKDLEDKLKVKEQEIKDLKNKLDKLQNPNAVEKKTKKHIIIKGCPDCNSEIMTTDMPHGKLELCKAACGWRRVTNK